MIKANHEVNPGGESRCGTGGGEGRKSDWGKKISSKSLKQIKPCPEQQRGKEHGSQHRGTIKQPGE